MMCYYIALFVSLIFFTAATSVKAQRLPEDSPSRAEITTQTSGREAQTVRPPSPQIPPPAAALRGQEPDVLLLLIRTEEAAKAIQAIRSLGLTMQSHQSMAEIGMSVFSLGMSGRKHVRQELQQRLPGAIIDANHFYYPSAGKARVYAPHMLNWPPVGDCPHYGRGLKLGMLDSAIDTGHPALDGQKVHIRQFITSGADTAHGTAIASLLVGNGQQEVQGLLPGADLYAAVVVGRQKNGENAANTLHIIQAIDWLLQKGVPLVNLSFTGQKANRILEDVLRRARRRGLLAFGAAGNNGARAAPVYPAAFESVIAITAVDMNRTLYSEANRGDYIDFAAPGVDIWAATSGKRAAYHSGTSFAVPFAVGVAAQYLAITPTLFPDLLVKLLSSHAENDSGNEKSSVGNGLIQAQHSQTCDTDTAF